MGEWIQISFGGNENVLQLYYGDGLRNSVGTLKTTELCTLKGLTLWYVNYRISIKLLKNNFQGTVSCEL